MLDQNPVILLVHILFGDAVIPYIPDTISNLFKFSIFLRISYLIFDIYLCNSSKYTNTLLTSVSSEFFLANSVIKLKQLENRVLLLQAIIIRGI